MKFSLRMLNLAAQLGVLTSGADTFGDAIDRQLASRAVLAEVWERRGVVEPTFYGSGHHWMSYPQRYADPFVVLGYVAAKWPEAHLNSNFIQLPLFSPTDIAEKVSSIGGLTDQGLTIVIGLGWRPEEFTAAGTDVKYRVSRFEESLSVLRSLLAGEVLDHHGKHWTVRGQLGAPLTDPKRVAFVAGAQSCAAAERAARLADGLNVPWTMNHESYDRINDAYRDGLLEHSRPAPRYWAMSKFISVDPVEKDAYKRLERMSTMFDWYRSSSTWTSSDVTTEIPLEDEARERTITGTPEAVVEQLEFHARKYPYTDSLLTWLAPGCDPDENAAHFEMLCEAVVAPLAERLGAAPGKAVLRI